jgi:hypothetical protein
VGNQFMTAVTALLAFVVSVLALIYSRRAARAAERSAEAATRSASIAEQDAEARAVRWELSIVGEYNWVKRANIENTGERTAHNVSASWICTNIEHEVLDLGSYLDVDAVPPGSAIQVPVPDYVHRDVVVRWRNRPDGTVLTWRYPVAPFT